MLVRFLANSADVIDREYFVHCVFSPSMQLTNNKRCIVRLTSVFR